jgi:predicted  nucleic acid-binding Zn-ribbon protein
MPGIPTEHLADQINRTNERLERAEKQLAEAIREMTREFASLRADVSADFRWMKRIGGFLAACALGLLGTAFYVVHRATQIEDAVIALQKDTARTNSNFARLESTVVALQNDTTQIKTSVVGLQNNFARLEGSVVALRQDTTDLKADFKARDDRLNHTLDRIEKGLPQPQPAPPRRDP